MVATDRISAYDCILPDLIPNKGKILTALSLFWFKKTEFIVPNHLISAEVKDFPEAIWEAIEDRLELQLIRRPPSAVRRPRSFLEGRSMLVKKAAVIPIECVVRGYLAGSAWQEYQEKGAVTGIKLPPGLKESQKLAEPIFTPATKAATGHDENISLEVMAQKVGPELTEELKSLSLKIYSFASSYAESKGIIIADTKFEFGKLGNQTILIDELLTPDSSRFWPLQGYQPGQPQPSFDKQYIRDYLDSLGWNHQPPAPSLPQAVIKETQARYEEAYERLTSQPDGR